MNDPENDVDCLYYPSVPNGLIACNIALKPNKLEELFNLVELSEDFCFKSADSNSRGWLSYRTAKGTNLDSKEELINWENETIPDERIALMMEQYSIKIT